MKKNQQLPTGGIDPAKRLRDHGSHFAHAFARPQTHSFDGERQLLPWRAHVTEEGLRCDQVNQLRS